LCHRHVPQRQADALLQASLATRTAQDVPKRVGGDERRGPLRVGQAMEQAKAVGCFRAEGLETRMLVRLGYRSGIGSHERGCDGDPVTGYHGEGEREVMPFKAPAPGVFRGEIAKENDGVIGGIAILAPPGEFTQDGFRPQHPSGFLDALFAQPGAEEGPDPLWLS